MLAELEEEIKKLPQYLLPEHRSKWNSLLINRYPPIVHRLSYKISDSRTLLLHKIHNCDGANSFMHSHSWPMAVKVIDGGYKMGLGFSTDSSNRLDPPPVTFTSFVKAGDSYEMLSSDLWHYTKCDPATKFSYSIVLIGPRERERLAQNNDQLSKDDQNDLFNYFENYCKINTKL